MAESPAVPEMHLELVPIPVTDVDRAKEFYERAGFGNLHDTQVTEAMRVVQLTPPGSSCAIVFGTGMGPINEMEPGSIKGLHLVVADMDEAREALRRGYSPRARAGSASTHAFVAEYPKVMPTASAASARHHLNSFILRPPWSLACTGTPQIMPARPYSCPAAAAAPALTTATAAGSTGSRRGR